MNWVDRRFARERNLADTTAVWAEVNAAILSSVSSFKAHYADRNLTVEIAAGNGSHGIKVLVTSQSTSFEISIQLTGRVISVTYTAGKSSQKTFRIDADQDSAYVLDGETRCDADEISRHILEVALFPESNPDFRVSLRK